MIRALCVSLIVTGSVMMTPSQAPLEGRQVMLSQDQAGGINVVIPLKETTFYLGEPSVSVPSVGLAGVPPTASRFTIRAWQEGSGARVVVYAVVSNDKTPIHDLEVAIGTYALANQPLRVTETAKWGASPLVLQVVRPLRK